MIATPDRTAWLKGENARCKTAPRRQLQPRRLVLLGAPGIGKGTQAEMLHSRFHIPHVATGDILRAEVANRTPLGLKAQPIMAIRSSTRLASGPRASTKSSKSCGERSRNRGIMR